MTIEPLNPPAPTLDQNTIDRCAAAIAEVRRNYRIADYGAGLYVVVLNDMRMPFQSFTQGVPSDCQAWIDREAARACIGTAMPEMPNDPAGWDATNAVRVYLTAVLSGEA